MMMDEPLWRCIACASRTEPCPTAKRRQMTDDARVYRNGKLTIAWEPTGRRLGAESAGDGREAQGGEVRRARERR
jgi:hypothetical protein